MVLLVTGCCLVINLNVILLKKLEIKIFEIGYCGNTLAKSGRPLR